VFKQKLWCGLTRWLACEWRMDFLSIRLVGVLRWGKTASSCRVVRAVVLSWQQLFCTSAEALFGQFLPHQGGVIQFWVLPSVPETSSGSTTCPALGGYPVITLPISVFVLLLISAECCWLLWEINLSLCLLAQPLSLSRALLGGSSSSMWLAFLPGSVLSLCSFMVCHWEFSTECSSPCPTPDTSALS
jgi:hypothetical protein